MRKRLAMLSLATAALLTLSACSSGSGAPAPSANGGDGSLTPITVGVIPVVDVAAIYLGKEQGFFSDEGLDVNLKLAQGGAAIVPAVVSGDYQFGFSNVVSLLVAQSNSVPIKVVAAGNATTGAQPDIGAVVVPQGSSITDPTQLAGKTVAVNTLNNIGDVTIRNVVEQVGGDASNIQFTEMGFPDMPAAVASKQVDAAWIVEPHLTRALNDGAKVISWNFAETDKNLVISTYFTSQPYAQQHPDTVAAFQRAMQKSLEYADKNPEAARNALDSYTKIDDKIKSAMTMPRFPTDINQDAVQKLADLSLKYGLIKQPADLKALLP